MTPLSSKKANSGPHLPLAVYWCLNFTLLTFGVYRIVVLLIQPVNVASLQTAALTMAIVATAIGVILWFGHSTGIKPLPGKVAFGIWTSLIASLLTATAAMLPQITVAPPVHFPPEFFKGAPHLFPPEFFKGAPHFYDDLTRTRADQTAKNLRVDRIIFFQYIRDEFQIGFRAYEGLAPIQDGAGILPLPMQTSSAGPVLLVDYIQWSNGSTPTMLTSARPNVKTLNSVTVNTATGPRNIAAFQFYRDPHQGVDLFRLPLNQFSSDQALIDHYVAVQNKDLDKWNPNKFVFEVVPNNEVLTNNTLTFSKAVYAVITSQSPRSSDALPYIEQLLITFDASDCRLEPKHCDENFKKVKERVDEIFDEKEKEFRSSVTVFHYQTKPRNADLIMLYTFP